MIIYPNSPKTTLKKPSPNTSPHPSTLSQKKSHTSNQISHRSEFRYINALPSRNVTITFQEAYLNSNKTQPLRIRLKRSLIEKAPVLDGKSENSASRPLRKIALVRIGGLVPRICADASSHKSALLPFWQFRVRRLQKGRPVGVRATW